MTGLCDIAVDTIAVALIVGVRRTPTLVGLEPGLREVAATFVTLEHDDRLLGCVGTLRARQALAVDVAEHALAAAFDDPRVPPVTRQDFPEMTVKVSVLSQSMRIDASSFAELRDRVRPGIDGLTVETGKRYRATLLPSVWSRVDDCDEFLGTLWTKAGLRLHAWPPGMQVSRYTTVEECDHGPRPALPDNLA